MLKYFKGPLLLFISFMLAVYSLLAFLTYNHIEAKIDKIDTLHEEVQQVLDDDGELSYAQRSAYNREVDHYDKLQSLLQSFWMKWVFNFPEFTRIE
ncbi:hypothetical protein LGQ02_03900 [Bacillus shivajii]|uniref:hypothetical protein n=1 Tax=Bacillus shivajii TaxID=1983719 RepID=UPI001CFA73B9|nr:hypothetical protein [Bacillus shivajii]UCZ53937.1 hypothetical protein LGQ02_03900 [Bacillus shivajii]